MRINPNIQSVRNLRNLQHVGGQRSAVSKKEISKGASEPQDRISISDQAKMGEKAGKTTGLAGQQGAKETKQDEFLNKLDKNLTEKEGELFKEIDNLSASDKQTVEQLQKEVNEFADKEEAKTGVKTDRTALLSQRIIAEPSLQGSGAVKEKASEYLKARNVHDAGNYGYAMGQAMGEGMEANQKILQGVGKSKGDDYIVKLEQNLLKSSENLANEIKNLSPEDRKTLAKLEKEVNSFAEMEEKATGQKIDRAALLAQRIMTEPSLQGKEKLQKASADYLKAQRDYDMGTYAYAMGQTMGAGMEQNQALLAGLKGAAEGGAGGPEGPGQTPPGGGTPNNGGPQGPSGTTYTEAAQKAKEMQDDLQQARTIYMQMAADRQKWMMKMWEILQDLQTSIMDIMQQVALRRAQTMDAIAAKWAAVLGGYA